MLDFMSNILPTLLQGFQGFNQQSTGFNLQMAGAKMSAKAYSQAADITRQQAEYNVELDRQTMNRNLDVFSRDAGNLLANQRNQMATTGASLGSKSFLAVTNATLDGITRQISNVKDANALQAQQRRYAATVSEVDLRNRALMAQYEYKLAAYNKKGAQFSAFEKLGNSLSGAFGGLSSGPAEG